MIRSNRNLFRVFFPITTSAYATTTTSATATDTIATTNAFSGICAALLFHFLSYYTLMSPTFAIAPNRIPRCPTSTFSPHYTTLFPNSIFLTHYSTYPIVPPFIFVLHCNQLHITFSNSGLCLDVSSCVSNCNLFSICFFASPNIHYVSMYLHLILTQERSKPEGS